MNKAATRANWNKTTVGAVSELITRGKAPLYCDSDGIQVVNQKCIRDGRLNLEYSRQTDALAKPVPDWAYLTVGDCLINSTGVGTLGRVAYVSSIASRTTFDSHVTLVRLQKDQCVPAYVGLNLHFREKEIELLAGGSTGQTELSRDAVGSLPLTLPLIVEQKRIVDVTVSVDAYIAALQQQADDARSARNAVLHELLTAGGADWTETTLGDIAEVVGGGTPATSNPAYWDGDIVWLTPTEVVAAPGSVLMDSARKITESGLKNSGARLLPEGTVILTSRASVGFSALAGTALATNQGFQSLIPSAQINNKFLMFWIQNNQQEFKSRAAGSTFKEISKANVRSIALALPPLSEQKRIVETVTAMDDVVSATEQAVRVAQELRSGLLSSLISGDHEIPESYDYLLGAA